MSYPIRPFPSTRMSAKGLRLPDVSGLEGRAASAVAELCGKNAQLDEKQLRSHAERMLEVLDAQSEFAGREGDEAAEAARIVRSALHER